MRKESPLDSTATALLEIGTEELPPRFFYGAVEQLQSFAGKKLAANRLTFEKINAYGTPRRLALEISGVVQRSPDIKKEVRGPAKASAYDSAGNSTPALAGFLRSLHTPTDRVQIKEFSGKPYVVVEVEEKGKPAAEILALLFPEIIRELVFPKSMRWNGNFLFGRPIRWLLALLDQEIIRFELAGLKSGANTFGHRFYSQKPIRITHPREYVARLQEEYVVVDHRTRAELIRSQVVGAALSKSGNIFQIESLLDEVVGLVEYPLAFSGKFEERFLALPKDVLISVMQHHQRYFPVIDKNQKLLPHFIGVRNGREEGLDDVRFGNEQVIRARFKDAEYFLSTDLKTKLLDRLKTLEKLVFQKNLGTLRQKVDRLKSLVDAIAKETGLETKIKQEDLELVVFLSKCDLATQMVFEFPDLQGVMGKEYAEREGYNPTVSQAILDHYLPRFQGDALPATEIGAVVGIADRVDTLAGCFSLKLKPTGSSDPLALRRTATTLVQLLVEKKLSLSLPDLFAKSWKTYLPQFPQFKEINSGKLFDELNGFVLERLGMIWKQAGIRYDLIRTLSPLALRKPVSSLERAQFLETFRAKNKEQFASFVQAWVRIFNILKSKEAQVTIQKVDAEIPLPSAAAFEAPEEKTLLNLLQSEVSSIHHDLDKNQISKAFQMLVKFQEPINTFFEKVLVMAPEEDVRKNRLLLLRKLRDVMLDSFGDLTHIVLD